MNNLTTRKIVLGLLMVCVLALGVQGSADAITKFTRGSGDLKLYAPGDDFTITFSVSLQGRVNDGAGNDPVTYHYDNESINIAVTGALIRKVGSYDITPAASHDMSEDGETATKLSSSVRLTLRASAAAPVTITITDTSDDNRPGTASDATPLVFNVYIAPEVDTASTIELGTNDGVEVGIGEQRIDNYFSGLTDVRVTYTVSGSGSVYVKTDNNKGSGSKSLTTSSAAPVYLDMRGSTNTVTASVKGQRADRAASVTYIYPPVLLTKQAGDKQKGAISARLAAPLVVKVVDGKNRAVSGVQIGFVATDDGSFLRDPSFPSNLYVPETGALTGVKTNSSGLANVFWVLGPTAATAQTATATLTGSTSIQANSPVFTATFGTTTSTARSIVIESGDGQRADENGLIEDPLVVVVRDQRGQRVNDTTVRFIARDGGTLDPPSDDEPGTATSEGTSSDIIEDVNTNSSGEASVRYTPPEDGGRRTVSASLQDNPTKFVTFTVNGAPSSTGGGGGEDDTGDPSPTITRTLDIDVSGTGSTREVTVTALQNGVPQTDIFVSLTVSSGASLSQTNGATPLESTLTLPTTAGTYTVNATTSAGYSSTSESVTVTVPGTLTARQEDGQIYVTASPAPSSNLAFTLTSGGARVGNGEILPAGWGRAIPVGLTTDSHILTVDADGYNATQVSFTPGSTPATGQQQQQQQQQQQAVGGTAESIEIEGSRTLEGTEDTSMQLRARVLDANDRGVSDVRVTFRILAPGQGRLSQRGNGRAVQVNTDRNGYATASLTPLGGNLIVEAKAAGVSAPVTFIIDVGEETEVEDTTGAAKTYKVGEKIPLSLTDTLTFRGSRTVNGTTYTCVGSGECVVSYGTLVKGEIRSATVSTVQSKTYKVGEKIPLSLEDTLNFTGSRTVSGTTYTCVGSGECVVSYGTLVKGEIRGVSAKTTTSDTATPSREINPVVQVAAANRPPMLWVDGGGIYALVGASVQRFAPSVDNALNLTVAGGKVYWTEKTGESAGTINSANLNGSGVTELASIQAVPMGIAVDTANSKLYWTNARGRIQSANLNGSRITNELQNLPGPKDIAVARGNVYWTQYDATAGAGSVGIANSTGRGSPKYISTGSDTPGSLVISGNKVYWTEMTGTSSGTINSANLNGNDAKELAAIRAVPMGIAVDGSRSKLYWTNSRGRIQSANLDGSTVENVVDGLGMPGDMVLSNSIQAPTDTTPIPPDTTAGTSKYDVNGDGRVDNTDASLVSTAMGTSTAKYDVNGDGTVNFLDLLLVFDNRSDGAAGAPMIVGMKLSAIQIDRLQEQIELLIATGDRSPAAMKTLIYLQQLIAMARPEKTQLFANYPNPFNPETWMPYELATDTNVRITIYNTQGVVIRTLQLGQQSAGYYTDRERAAYWDGKNALGEQVASGIYFYQLETDDMSLMRKMVILK